MYRATEVYDSNTTHQDYIRFNTSAVQVGHLLPGKELRTPLNQIVQTWLQRTFDYLRKYKQTLPVQ